MKEFKVVTESQDNINHALENVAKEGWIAISHNIHVYTVTYDHKPRVTVSVLMERKLGDAPKATKPAAGKEANA